MSDLRPDDTDFSERSSLPPELRPIHDRLIGDGARWRWRAPDGARLADWARATLDYADERGIAEQPRLREVRLEHLEAQLRYPPGPKGPVRDMTMTRIRGFVGAAAAIIVVGLIALLLTHNAALHGGTGASGDATPQPKGTPSGNSTQQNTQPLQPGQLPVVAQSDPTIVYMLKGDALMRSSNGGSTYVAETLPKTDLSSIDGSSLAVSPLDANHVFVTMNGLKDGQGCMASQPYPATAMHGGILASGYSSCSEQYLSVDGGHTWAPLRLPMQGVLGATTGFRSPPSSMEGSDSYIFQAQGQRLYAAMGYGSQGGSLMASEGARLVASDDGGVTWTLIDTHLASATQIVCDFAAAPLASTVYAVTEASSCGNESLPSMTLWRSADGGQSWSRVRQFPTLAESGLVVGEAESGLVVGAHGELYTFMPQATAASHSISVTNSPAEALVSVDGGVTFTSAPSAGLPSKPVMSGPYATLADGSVVYSVLEDAQVGQTRVAFYAWKKGDSAWRKIGSSISEDVVAVTVTPPAAGATEQTISLIGSNGAVSTVKVAIGQ